MAVEGEFRQPPARRRLVLLLGIPLVLALVVALGWTRSLDDLALTRTDTTLERALAAFAVARGLNGVISVAQGTELAIQPVGVGVTLTAGEVLDPLNDLVERFSWLALVACVSIGTQMLLTEVVVSPWMNGLVTVAAGAFLLAWWRPWPRPRTGPAARGSLAGAARPLLRILLLTVFLRFAFVAVTLATAWVDHAVLGERQDAALHSIQITQEELETLQEAVPVENPSMLERFGTFLDEQRQALDVKAQLDAFTERVETAIGELINLLVLFTVQTILVPVGALALLVWTFRRLWWWTWQAPRRDQTSA